MPKDITRQYLSDSDNKKLKKFCNGDMTSYSLPLIRDLIKKKIQLTRPITFSEQLIIDNKTSDSLYKSNQCDEYRDVADTDFSTIICPQKQILVIDFLKRGQSQLSITHKFCDSSTPIIYKVHYIPMGVEYPNIFNFSQDVCDETIIYVDGRDHESAKSLFKFLFEVNEKKSFTKDS